ncbi:MFS transporter [Agrococcus sp. SGAir0287]|uniref:MFS transporter n=1 Tax=Agrococcus sp. SGAir0287 TaxID=2070347 RepID=UPI0010CD6271|nr:MFS transporter [Agrococcus sp. SGAir0287]QCR19826.1 MFS transporter [Agrococcus sp. SGAir0287]
MGRSTVWRQPGFVLLWAGEGTSQLGTQLAGLAMPIVAVTMLQATDAEMGYLNAAQTAAFLIVGLPAGAWLDRMRKRHVMIVADLVRAAAIAVIPLLALLGHLEIWHLVAVGAVVGVATVFFDVGYQSFVPVLVDDEHVGDANGVLEATAQTMRLGGPALAGALLGILSAPVVLLANVAGFLVSVLALCGIRDREVVAPRQDRRPLHLEIAEGIRFVAGEDLLRRVVATVALSNLGSIIVYTLLPIAILRILGIDPFLFGVILSIGAVGALAGSLLAMPLARRIGEGTTITWSTVVFAAASTLLPLAVLLPDAAVVLLVVGESLFGFTVVVFNIVQVTARQRLCPKPLLGRMNACIRTVVWGIMPIGALLAGALGTAFGTVTAMWIGVALGALAIVPFMLSPFRTMRALPTRPSEAAHVSEP